MRILLVAATSLEIDPLLAELHHTSTGSARVTSYTRGGHDVDVLVTGVGMVATAAWSSRVCAGQRYDLALNLGVCGSFDRALAPGAVVHVISDCLAELGAEDDDRFVTIQDLGLLGTEEWPFRGGRLVNENPPANATLSRLPAVRGITVNTVHGNDRSIGLAAQRFDPQVESMEGAAFMYACMIHEVPFAQVRAVSNVVERRNRGAWAMPEAISKLCQTSLNILDFA